MSQHEALGEQKEKENLVPKLGLDSKGAFILIHPGNA